MEELRALTRDNPDDESLRVRLREAERKREWVEINHRWFSTKREQSHFEDERAANAGPAETSAEDTIKHLPRRVVVMGKVMTAGSVRIPEGEKMDIIQALAHAGGFQPSANLNKIKFSRNGETTTYRFKDLKKISDDSQKVWLEPGDVIEVQESVF